jgi:hypothetical protein
VVVEGLKGAGKKDKVNGVLTDNVLWPIMRRVNIFEAHVCITRLPVHLMAACLQISAYTAMASFVFVSILLTYIEAVQPMLHAGGGKLDQNITPIVEDVYGVYGLGLRTKSLFSAQVRRARRTARP